MDFKLVSLDDSSNNFTGPMKLYKTIAIFVVIFRIILRISATETHTNAATTSDTVTAAAHTATA